MIGLGKGMLNRRQASTWTQEFNLPNEFLSNLGLFSAFVEYSYTRISNALDDIVK